jgi:hypothetical protein
MGQPRGAPDDSLSGPGRSGLGPRRDPVFAALGPDDYLDLLDDDDGGGTAGMREPRRPLPNGPLSDAGARPLPEPPAYLTLADPRH